MIGIHESSDSYSDRWIEWCNENHVPFKKLNCLASDVIQQCEGLTAVLWHWTLMSLEEPLVARQIVASLEKTGIIVYPSVADCWHYDDKVGQKYLLEAIDAPAIPTWVFTDSDAAQKWISRATWPKVFKLRCGSSSENVHLVRSKEEAEGFCRRAFSTGFHAEPGYLKDARRRVTHTKNWKDLIGKIKRAPKSIVSTLRLHKYAPRQRGYVLFQEFLAGNQGDTRVTVIGGRAFGVVRQNRPNDFRASGSGEANWDPRLVDRRFVEIAFQLAEKLNTQSLAIDFLYDSKREPVICEISYCSVVASVYNCPGYWDREFNWHEGHCWPQDCIIEDVVAAAESKNVESHTIPTKHITEVHS
jgi:glutathione synthase/RimK-type ligase-like ATP-grasp enzyme